LELSDSPPGAPAHEGDRSMDLQYPIGKLERKAVLTPAERRVEIERIAQIPGQMSIALAGLTPAQLDTPYREGGWTVRQVVHHLADAHINGLIRFKLAATEQNPTIKPYDQEPWAELPDAKGAPVEISLALLTAVHQRMTALLESLKPADFARTFQHPEVGPMTIDMQVGVISWHGRHHVGHVASFKNRLAAK
jgi:hypothetical protein